MKFPRPAGTITQVTLRVYRSSGSTSGGLKVSKALSESWTERGVTYANQPARSALIASRSTTPSGWFDVAIPPSSLNASSTTTLVLDRDSTDSLALGSRESSTPPRLLVTTSTEPAPTPTPPTPTPTLTPPTPTPTPTPAPSSGRGELGTNAGLTPTKFVSPSGSDSNSCTQSAPCRSLTRADQLVAPGDVVSIASGTYDGGVLTKSGTSAARITYVSQSMWGASVRSLLDVRGAYVDVRNIEVTGATAGGLAMNGSYSRAIRNHIHHLPLPCGVGTGLWAGNGNDLPSAYASHNQELLDNVVNDIGPAGGWAPGSCQLTHGIYASVPDVKIIGNLVYRTIGDGITSWHGATRLTVVNNTVANAGSDGILIGNGDGGSTPTGNTGSYVANNISVNNYRHGITESGTASGNRYRNNLTIGNQWDCISCSTWSQDESGTMNVQPQFAGGDDFHPLAASPAVDSGIAAGAPATDLDGTLRPSGGGVDRGAYER